VSSQDAGREWIKISVKYPNTCEICRNEILFGEEGLWMKGSGRIKHVSCKAPNGQTLQTSSASPEPSKGSFSGKACTNCGSSLADLSGPKFCPSCGQGLSDSPTPVSLDQAKQIEGLDEADHQPAISIEELGRRLEDMMAQILRNMGYSTQVREIIRGTSGSRNEIDILAKRGDRVLAVECKNYARFVRADQLREFKSKLDDLQVNYHTLKGSGFLLLRPH
jgi:uncharacterized Zn finger protein (UPF0148 family)